MPDDDPGRAPPWLAGWRPTALSYLLGAAVCYTAWLAAAFFPIGIVHGVGVWFGGW